MLCFIFASLSLFFFAVAVFIFFAACKEMSRRDIQYRQSLEAERANTATEKVAVRSWRLMCETEQKKVHAGQEEIKSLRQTVSNLRDTLALQLDKVSQLESQKKVKGKKQDTFLQRNEECVICMETVPLMVAVPCGHVSTCMPCMKSMENPPCPICRQKGMFYEIYDSTVTAVDKKELQPQEIIKRKGLFKSFLDKVNCKK